MDLQVETLVENNRVDTEEIVLLAVVDFHEDRDVVVNFGADVLKRPLEDLLSFDSDLSDFLEISQKVVTEGDSKLLEFGFSFDQQNLVELVNLLVFFRIVDDGHGVYVHGAVVGQDGRAYVLSLGGGVL